MFTLILFFLETTTSHGQSHANALTWDALFNFGNRNNFLSVHVIKAGFQILVLFCTVPQKEIYPYSKWKN